LTSQLTHPSPLAATPAARPTEMTGLEHLEAIRDGRLPPPPIADTIGFDLVEVGHGRSTFEVEPGERHYNPLGTVHGGLAATLLDSAMGCAVQSTLEAGLGFTTVDLNVKFVRPMTAETGRVLCEGTVLHTGSKIATAEARLFSVRTGKLIAHGTCACMILRSEGADG
jgi:uncharacterized protein (TIGR00369 family)